MWIYQLRQSSGECTSFEMTSAWPLPLSRSVSNGNRGVNSLEDESDSDTNWYVVVGL